MTEPAGDPPAPPAAPRLRPWVAVPGLVGGTALFASVFLPWSRRGPGSAISARGLGDLALTGAAHAWVSPWLGAAVYVVPAAGALTLIGIGWGGRLGARVTLAALVLASLVTGIAISALVGKAHLGLGPGAMLDLFGLAVGSVSAGAGMHATSVRPTSEP